MPFVFGFDGGGTKTECVLMDAAGHVLSTARSGPSNPFRVGPEAAMKSIHAAAALAAQKHNITFAEIGALCAGLAGVGRAVDATRMRELIAAGFPDSHVHVCTDIELALGTAGDGPVLILIAGTGSAAFGRNAAGETQRAGGQGPTLGDQGSAFDIGRSAAIRAMQEFERRGVNSEFGRNILQVADSQDWQEFRFKAQQAPDEVFPRLFPVVAAAADVGEALAKEILGQAARELSSLACRLAERLALSAQSVPLILHGGALGRSVFFDQQLKLQISNSMPLVEFATPVRTPAEAAGKIALGLLASPAAKRS